MSSTAARTGRLAVRYIFFSVLQNGIVAVMKKDMQMR
jgi:hypothetical protein